MEKFGLGKSVGNKHYGMITKMQITVHCSQLTVHSTQYTLNGIMYNVKYRRYKMYDALNNSTLRHTKQYSRIVQTVISTMYSYYVDSTYRSMMTNVNSMYNEFIL